MLGNSSMIYNFSFSPGQACSAQTLKSVDSPEHFSPPFWACCSISLSLVWNPPPQDLVHALQLPYGPHLQSILAENTRTLKLQRHTDLGYLRYNKSDQVFWLLPLISNLCTQPHCTFVFQFCFRCILHLHTPLFALFLFSAFVLHLHKICYSFPNVRILPKYNFLNGIMFRCCWKVFFNWD